MAITVETRCEHCSEPMTLEVDSEMTVLAEEAGAEPLVFTPDVAPFDVEDVSIIDDF